jgi:hypothetical protein
MPENQIPSPKARVRILFVAAVLLIGLLAAYPFLAESYADDAKEASESSSLKKADWSFLESSPASEEAGLTLSAQASTSASPQRGEAPKATGNDGSAKKTQNLKRGRAETANFHIAVVTGDAVQGAEDVLAAYELLKRYGNEKDGGMIKHVIYPDEFLNDPDAMSKAIEDLASDSLLKVVAVNQSIPGTAEGFRRLRAARPDVLLLAGEPHEDPELLAENADLVVMADYKSRGYLLANSAKKLGADTFVYITFDRHLSYETVLEQCLISKEAASDLRLKFAVEIAPDPAEVGTEEARQFILDKFPGWLKKYGKKTAFYATNDAHTVPLISKIVELGGYFVEPDIPSTLMGYPDAFDLDLEPYLGQWIEILKIVENAVVKAGGKARLGAWAYPLGYIETAGLVEFGRLIAEGKADILDIDAFLNSLGMFSPEANWNGTFLNDKLSGKPMRNFFLVYQDTYVFGLGNFETTDISIPEKYYHMEITASAKEDLLAESHQP